MNVIYARMEWLEMEGKTAEAKEEVEKSEKGGILTGMKRTCF